MKANYKFLTTIDLSSNNIYNISKIIGNDYDTVSSDLEISTCDRANAGNLLLRSGIGDVNGYVHIYSGSSTEEDAPSNIYVNPDGTIDISGENVEVEGSEEILIHSTTDNYSSKISIVPSDINISSPTSINMESETITDNSINRNISSVNIDIVSTLKNPENEEMFHISVNEDLTLTQTQNLKVNKVANFNNFTIFWDESIHSLVFAEGQAEWQ